MIDTIPRLIKKFRQVMKPMTQEDLAHELVRINRRNYGDDSQDITSRFIVNRIENGHTTLGWDVAECLDLLVKEKEHEAKVRADHFHKEALKIIGKPFASFVSLLEESSIEQDERDFASVIGSDRLRELSIVLCSDHYDIAGILANILSNKAHLDIKLLVPSRTRIGALFNVNVKIEEIEQFYEEVTRYLEQQTNRLKRLEGKSDGNIRLKVYASDSILNSVIIAKTDTEINSIHWPCRWPGMSVGTGDMVDPLKLLTTGPEIATRYFDLVEQKITDSISAGQQQYFGNVYFSYGENPSDGEGRLQYRQILPVIPKSQPRIPDDVGRAVSLMLPYISKWDGEKQRSVTMVLLEEDRSAEKLSVFNTLLRASDLISAIDGELEKKCGALESNTDEDVKEFRREVGNWKSEEEKHLFKDAEDLSKLVGSGMDLVVKGEKISGNQDCDLHSIIDESFRIAAQNELQISFETNVEGLNNKGISTLKVFKPNGRHYRKLVAKETDTSIVVEIFLLKLDSYSDVERMTTAAEWKAVTIKQVDIEELIRASEDEAISEWEDDKVKEHFGEHYNDFLVSIMMEHRRQCDSKISICDSRTEGTPPCNSTLSHIYFEITD